jgi:SulP family sulfate permease
MLAAIAIPEQIATARLAGMPPQTGLYAFAAGTLAFALFGRNRYASVGADSTIAPIFAGAIAALAVAGGAPYPALVVALALMTGVVLIVAGIARAGWIADLLSVPVITGFLAGIAVHIIVGQLPLVLGVASPSGSLLVRALAIARDVPHANPFALAVGIGVLALTFGAERVSARVPGALIGLIAAGVAAAALHLPERGVAVLGALPSTAPSLHLGLVAARDALRLAPVAFIVALVCMVQTSVVLRSFPDDPDVAEDPSRDFAAVGAGSIVASLAGAFPVDASPPRTAVVRASGGRTQFAGLVAVAAVVALIAFGASLTAQLPLAALGGILIFIGLRLLRIADMVRIARVGGGEIWLLVAGALLIIAVPIEAGMLLAIVLSLLHGIYIVARPPSNELFRIPGTTIWWPPEPGERGEREAGVVVFAPAAPVAFTNANYIVRRMKAVVRNAPQPVRFVVLEGGGVIDVDYTGGRVLAAAIRELRAQGIAVAIARLADPRARAAARRVGVFDAVGAGRVFMSVHEALDALRAPSA